MSRLRQSISDVYPDVLGTEAKRRVSVCCQRRAVQVKSKQDAVSTHGYTSSDTVVVVNLMSFVVKFLDGHQQVAEEHIHIRTSVINIQTL